MTMMEILLALSDAALERLEIARDTIGNTEAMIALINRMLAVNDFTKAVRNIYTSTNDTIKVYGLVATGLDDEYLWCNNGAVIISQEKLGTLFCSYLDYLTSIREGDTLFQVGDIITPVLDENGTSIIGLPTGNYKVTKYPVHTIDGAVFTSGIQFYKGMQIMNINNTYIHTINSDKLFTKVEFDWANVERERIRMKIKPVVQQLIAKDKDQAYNDYEVAMQNIIKATRKVEAVNNEKNMDAYIDSILSNISASLVRIEESEMIEKMRPGDNFKYTITTAPITCNNSMIGQYIISIDLIGGSVSMKHAWLSSSYTPHPHVRTNGYCCWGGLTNNVVEGLKLWNVSLIVECCIALLQSYNPHSAYTGLENVINAVKQTKQYADLMTPKTYWDNAVMFNQKKIEWLNHTLEKGATSLIFGHQVYSVII